MPDFCNTKVKALIRRQLGVTTGVTSRYRVVTASLKPCFSDSYALQTSLLLNVVNEMYNLLK